MICSMGYGGYSIAYVNLHKGDTLYIAVGGAGRKSTAYSLAAGGWNGGGTGTYHAGSGGGVYDEVSRTITWTVTAKPHVVQTVSFQARVLVDSKDIYVRNTAKVELNKKPKPTPETENLPMGDPEKDVYDSDGCDVNGDVVYAGEALTYTVTYTNDSDETRKYTVTDKIPCILKSILICQMICCSSRNSTGMSANHSAHGYKNGRKGMKQKVKNTLMALAFYCALLAGPAVAVIGADGRNQGNAGTKAFPIRPGPGYTGAHVPEVYIILFVLCVAAAGCVLACARKSRSR